MKSKKIAVMIPCFNEELTIQNVITKWRNKLPEADIFVYDNASTDQTVIKAENAGAMVRSVHDKGKGNVVRQMFNDNIYDCMIMVDGDDTYSEENADQMINMVLNEDYDMVIGTRLSSGYFEENKKITHSIGNVLINKMINIMFHARIKDSLSGLRAFSKKFTDNIKIESDFFEIETEITIKSILKKMKIGHVSVKYKDRITGSHSKINTFTDGAKIIFKAISLYWRNRYESEKKF